MDAAKVTFAEVLRDGQRLAESGPAELDVQRMLERIDDVAASYKQVRSDTLLGPDWMHFHPVSVGQGTEANGRSSSRGHSRSQAMDQR